MKIVLGMRRMVSAVTSAKTNVTRMTLILYCISMSSSKAREPLRKDSRSSMIAKVYTNCKRQSTNLNTKNTRVFHECLVIF